METQEQFAAKGRRMNIVTKNQPHPRKNAPVIAESAIDPQAGINGLGVECRGVPS